MLVRLAAAELDANSVAHLPTPHAEGSPPDNMPNPAFPHGLQATRDCSTVSQWSSPEVSDEDAATPQEEVSQQANLQTSL